MTVLASIIRVMLYTALLFAVIYGVPRLSQWWESHADVGAVSAYSGAQHTLPSLSDDQRLRLLLAAENAVRESRAAVVTGSDEFSNMPQRAYVVLWRDGRRLSSSWAQSDNLLQTVARAATQAAANLPKFAGDPLVQVQVMGRACTFRAASRVLKVHFVSMSPTTR